MAIEVVIAPTVEAVSGVSTEFIATGPFVLYGDGFGVHEKARLLRLGPSGTFQEATNDKVVIEVSAFPNMVVVDAPGTYRIQKFATVNQASVGYEES